MPHLRLEYTRNCRPDMDFIKLFQRLHQVLSQIGGIHIDNCKSRAYPLDTFLVGQHPRSAAFVHLEVKILEGRTEEVKRAIGEGLLEQLRQTFLPAPEGLELQLTVALGELQRRLYFKEPPGTLGRRGP